MDEIEKYTEKKFVTRETELVSGILVIFGLLSGVILPSISIGSYGIYFVTILSPAIFTLNFLAWSIRPAIHRSALFPLALGCMVCLSSLYSWIAGHSSFNYRDLFESVKYFQFLPYLLALSLLGRGSLKIIHYLLVISAIWVGFVGFLQVSGINYLFSYMYLGPDSSHIESVISGKRITLTGSDPNTGGVIACFFSIYFFSLFFTNKNAFNFFVFLAFFLLCFMTQSRTALVAVLFGLSGFYILFNKSFFIKKWLVIFCALSFVVFLVFYLDLSYIYVGFQYALEGQNNSLNVRFENIISAYQRFLESPVFGVGPAKSSYETIVDSEYALILQRYGLVGVILFTSYFFYLLRLAYRNLGSHWGVSLFVFLLMSILVMITNNIFSGYQLMSLIVILNIACVLNERKNWINRGVTF